MQQRNRDRFDREQMRDRYNREQNEDWAQQVPWEGRQRGPYRDYGWERGQSDLPEFRDPGVHITPNERGELDEWGQVNWNRDYNYGTMEMNGPYAGIGPKGYQRSDERIFEDVCERLTRHGRIDARNMQVEVKNGEVSLNGSVDSRQTKRMAEQVIEQVRGVRDVHNELRVEPQNRQNQSGMPGGGRGRVDEVSGSGVYPASGPMPQRNAPVQGEASWGQGERGAEGYQDSGRSEIRNQQEKDRGKKA